MRQEHRHRWWHGFALAAAAVLAYAATLHAPFVFDDLTSIPQNPTIRHLWPPWAPLVTPRAGGLTVTGRPLLNLSLAVDYAVSGKAPWSYHATNIAIHALAALLLFGLVRRTLAARGAASPNDTLFAFACSLVWALHPLDTGAVAYVIQRAESLMALCLLATLYGLVRNWPGLSIAACLCGMATKENMVAAPLLALAYDRTFLSPSFTAACRARRGLYLGLALTWLPLAWLVVRSGGNRSGSIGFGVGVGWWDHALTQPAAMLHYLRLVFWPAPLVFDYEPVWVHGLWSAWIPALFIAALATTGIVLLLRRSAFGFLAAVFFAILAPSALMPAPSELIVEYRMYLPAAAVIVAAALGLRSWRAAAAPWVLIVAALVLGVITLQRNRDYRTALALWQDTVAKRPGNALAHELLGQALDAADQRARGLDQHAQAVALRPDLAVAQTELGDDLLWAGRTGEAILRYREALRVRPDAADAAEGLGRALAVKGDFTGAVDAFAAGLRLAPDFAPARHNLAVARFNEANEFAQRGRLGDAIPLYEAALRDAPDFADAEFNLATALAASGQSAAAIPHFEAALRLRPDFADAKAALEKSGGGAASTTGQN